MPSKTLAARDEPAAPRYKKKLILACSNTSGARKLRFMCIGKFTKPTAIKNFNLTLYHYNILIRTMLG